MVPSGRRLGELPANAGHENAGCPEIRHYSVPSSASRGSMRALTFQDIVCGAVIRIPSWRAISATGRPL